MKKLLSILLIVVALFGASSVRAQDYTGTMNLTADCWFVPTLYTTDGGMTWNFQYTYPPTSNLYSTSLGFYPSYGPVSFVYGSEFTQTTPDANGFSILHVAGLPAASTQSSVSRAITSTAYLPSSTLWTHSHYSILVTCNLTVLAAASGTVYLEVCASSSFSSGVQELDESTTGFGAGLLQSNTGTATLTGDVPPGWYARIRTSGTNATFTYKAGQEKYTTY